MKILESEAVRLIPKQFEPINLDLETFYKASLIKLLNPAFLEYGEMIERYLVGVTATFAIQNSPFYSRHYSACAELLARGTEEFLIGDLPSLQRRHLVESGSSIHASNELDLPSFSSGTTSGTSLSLIHSQRGKQNTREVFRKLRLQQMARRKMPPTPDGFALKLAMLPTGHDGNTRQFTVFSKIAYGMKKAMDRLQTNATDPESTTRISFISGHPFDVVDLTMQAISQFGQDFERVRAPVKAIQTTGTYVSPHLRSWLEDIWQAELIDTLSFSEAPVFANSCSHCNLYHFHPFCHAEAVDQHDNPIREGRGRLLITSYYPLSITTPIIRYEIGDYVERKITECPNGSVGYRFLGRIRDSVAIMPDQGTESFLGAAEIVDILDDLPDVNRPVPINNVGFHDFVRDQKHWPLYELKNDGQRLFLFVQLKYPTKAFPSRVNELRANLISRLAARAPWLHVIHDPERFQIIFREPERRII